MSKMRFFRRVNIIVNQWSVILEIIISEIYSIVLAKNIFIRATSK